MALQGPRRGRPALLGLNDPGDMGRSACGVFGLEPRRQLQHLSLGARGDLALRWEQRVEPAGPPRPNPAVQAGPRHLHRLPERPDMDLGGHIPHQPASFSRRQVRIGQRPDQRVPIQSDITRSIRPCLLRSWHCFHTSTLSMLDGSDAVDPDPSRRLVTDASLC